MKPSIRLDRRAWCPLGGVTDNGLLLSRDHVAKVCKDSQFQAARETTAIIKRMMQS